MPTILLVTHATQGTGDLSHLMDFSAYFKALRPDMKIKHLIFGEPENIEALRERLFSFMHPGLDSGLRQIDREQKKEIEAELVLVPNSTKMADDRFFIEEYFRKNQDQLKSVDYFFSVSQYFFRSCRLHHFKQYFKKEMIAFALNEHGDTCHKYESEAEGVIDLTMGIGEGESGKMHGVKFKNIELPNGASLVEQHMKNESMMKVFHALKIKQFDDLVAQVDFFQGYFHSSAMTQVFVGNLIAQKSSAPNKPKVLYLSGATDGALLENLRGMKGAIIITPDKIDELSHYDLSNMNGKLIVLANFNLLDNEHRFMLAATKATGQIAGCSGDTSWEEVMSNMLPFYEVPKWRFKKHFMDGLIQEVAKHDLEVAGYFTLLQNMIEDFRSLEDAAKSTPSFWGRCCPPKAPPIKAYIKKLSPYFKPEFIKKWKVVCEKLKVQWNYFDSLEETLRKHASGLLQGAAPEAKAIDSPGLNIRPTF